MNDKTIKDLLHEVYRLIKTRKEFVSSEEYPGKEIDVSYFNGMDDGLREIFGRLDMYNILDLPLVVAEAVVKENRLISLQLGKLTTIQEDEDGDK